MNRTETAVPRLTAKVPIHTQAHVKGEFWQRGHLGRSEIRVLTIVKMGAVRARREGVRSFLAR